MQTANQEQPTLAQSIARAVDCGELVLPPLPELATKLRAMLADEDCDWKELAGLIHNEPSIVTALLRMANSAAFGGLREITDLNQAIARLGSERVVSLVTTILHKDQFRAENPSRLGMLKQLWDHAVTTAICSRRLALRGDGDGEEAFLAGLLHDTGKLLVLKGVDILEAQSGEPRVTEVVVHELMETLHTELGYKTLKDWKIGHPIRQISLRHHDEPDPENRLMLWVQAANVISRKMGSHLHPQPDMNLLDDPAIESLQLSDIDLASLIVDIEDEVTELRNLFQ